MMTGELARIIQEERLAEAHEERLARLAERSREDRRVLERERIEQVRDGRRVTPRPVPPQI